MASENPTNEPPIRDELVDDLKARFAASDVRLAQERKETLKMWRFLIVVAVILSIGFFFGFRLSDYFNDEATAKAASASAQSLPQSESPELLRVPLTATEAYELQERCTKSSNEYFRREGNKEGRTSGDRGDTDLEYESHYNVKLNKCLQLMTSSFFPKDKSGRGDRKVLYDVLANKTIGVSSTVSEHGKVNADLTTCDIEGVTCTNAAEFESRIKPYMTQ